MDSITYIGNGQVRVDCKDKGKVCVIRKGDTVRRGDIPNDAFDALSLRPDFGADLDTYRASLAGVKMDPKVEEPEVETPEEAVVTVDEE